MVRDVRVGVQFSVVIAVACVATVAGSGETLEFEDLFGFCGDYDLVRGPGSVSIEGLLFTSPDIYTYNVGRENSFPPGLGNPFESDSYHFFTFGAGATIDFPVSIRRLRVHHRRADQHVRLADLQTHRRRERTGDVRGQHLDARVRRRRLPAAVESGRHPVHSGLVQHPRSRFLRVRARGIGCSRRRVCAVCAPAP